MHRFFAFWWLCARKAFWGNAPFANDWQWVFGNPLASALASVAVAGLGALAPTVAMRLGATEMTTGTPALDSFLGALAAFLLTWLVAYVIRFLNTPVELFHEQKERADKLGAIARLVGIKGGVVSGVFNLESSGVEAPDWRPRHDKQYHEA